MTNYGELAKISISPSQRLSFRHLLLDLLAAFWSDRRAGWPEYSAVCLLPHRAAILTAPGAEPESNRFSGRAAFLAEVVRL